MTARAFTGAAGNGKTTKLLCEVEAHLAAQPLSEGQRVLALTFMHGSRFRLMERLSKSSIRRRFDCLTFDRFAWEVCRRWRSRLKTIGISLPVDAPDYDGTCDAAGQLLNSADVVRWIASRYPVLLVDEFQDCAAVRLAIRSEVQRAVQHVRSIQSGQNGRRAMTIHQAKNREFPIVIVLWPFAAPTDAQQARRWLYNAVTRAKKRAIVLVQDPKKARLSHPPFV
jgi:superfamily I DNA/RNA helicase